MTPEPTITKLVSLTLQILITTTKPTVYSACMPTVSHGSIVMFFTKEEVGLLITWRSTLITDWISPKMVVQARQETTLNVAT